MNISTRRLLGFIGASALIVAFAMKAEAQPVTIVCPSPLTVNPAICGGTVGDYSACGCKSGLFEKVCTIVASGLCIPVVDPAMGCEISEGNACTVSPIAGGTPEAPEMPCPTCSQNGPQNAEGAPVSVATGEMYFDHSDATVGSISFSRNYNTSRLSPLRSGMFGPGWNSGFDRRFTQSGAGTLQYRGEDGSPIYFDDSDLDGTFEQRLPRSSSRTVEASVLGFRLIFRGGGEELYSTAGRLLSSTNASGVTTTITRDGSNRITGISREGRSMTLTYTGAQTFPSQLKGPSGEVLATYGYDSSNRLISVDYPGSHGYRYVYDANGRIIFVEDADGKPSEAHEYDSSGRAITSEIGDGRQKYTFSFGSTSTTVTDALGNATVYDLTTVDRMPFVAKRTGPCSSCGGAGDVWEWTYNANGYVTSKKDAAGKIWSYTYDPVTFDLLTETDPLSQVTTYTYDAEGRTLTRTEPDGATTTFIQSPDGPTSVTQTVTSSDARVTTIAYHATNGRPQTITDARGKVTTMAYDVTTGDLTSVTDPLSHVTTFTYDTLGRRTKITDALGHETATESDTRGRLLKMTRHDGTHSDFAYDRSGRRASVTDPLGRVTRYLYDRYSRLTAVIDPMNQATRYGYDLMGNLLTLTDAKNQTTTFEYDGKNRIKKTIYPGGAYETFTYDVRGRLATMVNRKGTTTTYAYDDLGRLTGKTFSDSTPAFSYTYDSMGRMLTAANGADTLTWTYNLAGEVLTEQSSRNSSTLGYTYDARGNRLTVSLDGSLFVTYGYDDASRMTSITRASNVFGLAYDAGSRRTSLTYPNGVDTMYAYDDLNRLVELGATKTSSSTPITHFSYAYNTVGVRTEKTTLDHTENYTYDALSRLTRAERIPATGGPVNQVTLPRESGHIDSTPPRVIGVIDGAAKTTSIYG